MQHLKSAKYHRLRPQISAFGVEKTLVAERLPQTHDGALADLAGCREDVTAEGEEVKGIGIGDGKDSSFCLLFCPALTTAELLHYYYYCCYCTRILLYAVSLKTEST